MKTIGTKFGFESSGRKRENKKTQKAVEIIQAISKLAKNTNCPMKMICDNINAFGMQTVIQKIQSAPLNSVSKNIALKVNSFLLPSLSIFLIFQTSVNSHKRTIEPIIDMILNRKSGMDTKESTDKKAVAIRLSAIMAYNIILKLFLKPDLNVSAKAQAKKGPGIDPPIAPNIKASAINLKLSTN